MTIFNLGSINADYTYRVPHIPQAGETLASTALRAGLGGKGANQSVAIVRAGGQVVHIGAVGADGAPWLDRLQALGVDTQAIAQVDAPTGHAIITVADDGENAITLCSGANMVVPQDHISAEIADLGSNDWLLLQNETNAGAFAAARAKACGARVAYAAAPFSIQATQAILPNVDLLVVNEGEAKALCDSYQCTHPSELPVAEVIVTYGAKGARHFGKTEHSVPSPKVDAVDTTGAGDTFLGYYLAGIDEGLSVGAALHLACHAAALKVTWPGTADAIPSRSDVQEFIARLT